MGFDVRLTEDAVRDLGEIHDYLCEYDDAQNAEHVLDRLASTVESLATHPERDSFPKGLLTLGIREYRQVFFEPYRLICRIMGKRVYVYLLLDGRRDMQELLARRLLET